MAGGRDIAYLCREVDGDRLIYVSGPGGQPARMYVGVVGEVMREVQVFDFERLRDGGSTYIFTAEGTFFAPTRLVSDGQCRWPTKHSSEDVCGWPTPDAWRVAGPIEVEGLFAEVPHAEYVVDDDGNGIVVIHAAA